MMLPWIRTSGAQLGRIIPPDDELLAAINSDPMLERKLSAEDIYIRSGRVCNNQKDHYSTRFTDRSLDQIVGFYARGVNWHRQHDAYSALGGLPIGRAFRAAIEPIENVEGGRAVRAWWYYAKNDPTGDQIERYVALGIYRELSLAWWMSSFTCDVDGKDVDESDFYPGQVLSDGRQVVGIMDDVTDVAEFSLVSRGGQIGTTIERGVDGTRSIHAAIERARERIATSHRADPMGEWWYGTDQRHSRERQGV